MELMEALRTRRSCRNFLGTPVEEEKLQVVLEAAGWAPSVMNLQPWRFIVVKNPEVKQALQRAAEDAVRLAYERSGWKWLGKYRVDFLSQAPVVIVVTADPRDTGADQFLRPPSGYAMSCCAAIQNLMLAAHDLGLATLWYSLFDKQTVSHILGLPPHIEVISLVVLGYPAGALPAVPRRPIAELTTVLE
ncbi:MAG: nitroreductase family protein [Syntrophomonadaceae bacterium]|jgi:nitroreductase|nr:nitroreductase family protein [Syntrophomonadaceae bacterium]MDH7498664.1 nitroreductase family protein [Syntrophomonadaceae bacterium]